MGIEKYVIQPAKHKHGVFLVFEGMDCSGKSTAVNWAVDKLKELNIPVTHLRQPGGTEVGEKIRELVLHGSDMNPMTELLLMQASRAEAYYSVIKHELDKGNWVVCDRFTASSYAYQGAGRGLDFYSIKQHIEKSTPSSRIDCNIYIHRPFEAIMDYMNYKEKDRLESLDEKTLRKIYDCYEELFNNYETNWYRISNEFDIRTYKNEVETLMVDLVNEYNSRI